jgi:hypothetical protein
MTEPRKVEPLTLMEEVALRNDLDCTLERDNGTEMERGLAQAFATLDAVRERIAEMEAAHRAYVADYGGNVSLNQRIAEVERERDYVEEALRLLTNRMQADEAKYDALRAECGKCGLAFAHGLKCHALAQNEGGERGR